MSIDIHLAIGGDDCNPGRSDAPVATLERARDLLRSRRIGAAMGPARVIIHGGRYVLDRTLALAQVDGGTSDAPVTWLAAPGERVEISGGRRITGWSAGSFNGAACLSAQLPDGLDPQQLFVDGQRRPRPRLPRIGYLRVASTFGECSAHEVLWGEGPTRAEYHPGDLRAFRNLADVRFVAMGAWYDMWMRITGIDEAKREIRFHDRCWQRLVDETGKASRYHIDNVAEAFGEPGDWYVDRPSQRIHYVPLPGQVADTMEVIAPAVDLLVHVRGDEQEPAGHIRFENIAFAHCDWHPPADFRGSIQAGHRKPGSILFEHAERCVLYGCEVSKVAQYGVQLGEGSHDCRVIACSLHDLGAGGVHIDHEWTKPHSIEVADAGARRSRPSRPRAGWVTDCTIRDGGKIYPGAVGIYVGNAAFNRLLHNEITDLHYSGISVGWTWGSAPTACVDNRIEGNHVHHINQQRTFSDLGLIYTLGAQPGSTIRGNRLHDIDSYGYGGNGIYGDEGTGALIIEDNIAWNCKACGFGGAPRDVWIRNNIFAFTGQTAIAPAYHGSDWFASVCERNVLLWREGTCGSDPPSAWTPHGTHAIGNLLWRCGLPINLNGGKDLPHWQAQGQLLDTLVVDPGFVDAAGGDFRLHPGAAAVAHGFEPIDQSEVGPRGGPVLPLTWAEWSRIFPDPSERSVVFARLEQREAGRVRLRLANPGRVHSRGAYHWQLNDGVRIAPAADVAVDLAPGEETTLDLEVAAPPGMHRILILPSDRGWNPAAIVAELGAPTWSLPVLAGRIDPAIGLDRLPAEHLTIAGRVCGTVRMARDDGRLLVTAHLIDALVEASDPFWEGSCFEVYLATGMRGQPVQIVLIPDLATGRMRVHRQHMFTPVPLPDVVASCWRTADGYACAAAIPFADFRIADPSGAARLEVTAGVHASAAASSVEKAAWFHAPLPHRLPLGMATIEL